LDGPQKASARQVLLGSQAKDMLFAVYLSSPHAHARVTSIDTSMAEQMAGVRPCTWFPRGDRNSVVGTELQR